MSAVPPNDRFESIASITARCRGEFHEMPGLRLTLHQAARFLGIDPCSCEVALNHLVSSGFLRKNGAVYQRVSVLRD